MPRWRALGAFIVRAGWAGGHGAGSRDRTRRLAIGAGEGVAFSLLAPALI